MLSLNVVTIVCVIINLLVLYALFRKFLYKRVVAVMDKRKELLESQFADAKQKNEEADRLKTEYEESLSGAREESARIVEEAKERAEKVYDKLVAEAQETSQNMIQKANESIEMEREKARKEAQSEITGLALAAAAKIIGETSNSETDANLYNQFLAKSGEKNDANSN